MGRLSALLLVLLSLAVPASAQDFPRLVGQVPLLPLDDAAHEDIDALVQTYWQAHFNTETENAFGRQQVRVGRFDLNADGRAEMVLMVDAPGWNIGAGSPFVVAQWIDKKWVAIGWGWGDEDTLFATDEMLGGWRSIDTGSQLLRWTGKEYAFTEKEEPPPLP